MDSLYHIDPIKVSEGLKRSEERASKEQRAQIAGKALTWFHNAQTRDISNIVTYPKLVGANIQKGSSEATLFLEEAFQEFRKQLLIRAVEIAKEHFNEPSNSQ